MADLDPVLNWADEGAFQFHINQFQVHDKIGHPARRFRAFLPVAQSARVYHFGVFILLSRRYDNGHDLEDLEGHGGGHPFSQDIDPNQIFQAFFGGGAGGMGGPGGGGQHFSFGGAPGGGGSGFTFQFG